METITFSPATPSGYLGSLPELTTLVTFFIYAQYAAIVVPGPIDCFDDLKIQNLRKYQNYHTTPTCLLRLLQAQILLFLLLFQPGRD